MNSSPIKITVENPRCTEVRRLVAALSDYLRPLSPPEFQFQMSAEELAEQEAIVFMARDPVIGAVGLGALKIHDGETGELKSMFVSPQMRGKGVGGELVSAICSCACSHKLSRLVLETGVGPGYAGAHKLYERLGFKSCGAVLDYPDSGYSKFYEKRLSA